MFCTALYFSALYCTLPQVFSPPATKETPSNFASPLLAASKSSLHSSSWSINTSDTHHSRKTTCSIKTDKSDCNGSQVAYV